MDLPDALSIDIDPDSLTIDDMEVIEEITGQPADEIMGAGKPRAKALKALVFVTLRKRYPDITLEDVGRIRISAATMSVPTAVDPTTASAP